MVNDVSIIATIIAIFLLVGTTLPFINNAFGIPPEETDCFTRGIAILVDDMTNATTALPTKTSFEPVTSVGSLGMFDVVKSIIGMFFWTCGGLPVFIDLFFLLLRVILIVLLVRLIRSGGG